ncbi:PREDICTED: eukaryotic translation initiation factor 3 subunit K-like, partial [Gekko japonicus]|uniref:Eukaryotic translation initiation factor 3 subunit K n=1 Tax=Gekko japonicus TaxID=146911 RepID=A0ABM1K761_GEKJA
MALFEQMRANVGKLLKGIDRYNPENLATLERYVETQAKENAYDLEANLAVLKLYQFNPAFFQTTVTAQILLKALTNLPHTDFTLCKCMIDQAHVSFVEGGSWCRATAGRPSHKPKRAPLISTTSLGKAGVFAASRFPSSAATFSAYLTSSVPSKLSTPLRLGTINSCEDKGLLESVVAPVMYQFNPAFFQTTVTAQILLKALTNLPHTDFTLCKCMIDQAHQALDENMDLLDGITGFEDSVRKFICHVVGITYQHIDRWLLAKMLGDLTDNQLKSWMSKYGWTEPEPGTIFICNQEESIKPKNIVEKIDFD